MEFDKNKVYTLLNADELKVGSKVIVGDNLLELKECVLKHRLPKVIKKVELEDSEHRFLCDDDFHYTLAYLISEPEEKKMTSLEERAEEYIEKNSKMWEEGELTVDEIVRLTYKDCAKENGIQWHDLREDPNDLPIGEVFYWFDENPNLKDVKVYGRSIGYYNPYEKEWHGYYKGCPCRVHNVIAWCEIPTFDKE